MITKAEAEALSYRDELHYGLCRVVVGTRGGRVAHTETWRVNGQCKTWKTEPTRFSVPIKYGLRGYGYLTDRNAHEFHLPSDCVPVDIHQPGQSQR